MFKLTIITPSGLYLEEEVSSLTLKLVTGYRTILSGHLPLIGALDYAPMHFYKDDKKHIFSLSGGALNVKDDGSVTIITNAIESKEFIDISRAISAKERAEARLNNKDPNIDTKRAELALLRAISRIKTYESE